MWATYTAAAAARDSRVTDPARRWTLPNGRELIRSSRPQSTHFAQSLLRNVVSGRSSAAARQSSTASQCSARIHAGRAVAQLSRPDVRADTHAHPGRSQPALRSFLCQRERQMQVCTGSPEAPAPGAAAGNPGPVCKKCWGSTGWPKRAATGTDDERPLTSPLPMFMK